MAVAVMANVADLSPVFAGSAGLALRMSGLQTLLSSS